MQCKVKKLRENPSWMYSQNYMIFLHQDTNTYLNIHQHLHSMSMFWWNHPNPCYLWCRFKGAHASSKGGAKNARSSWDTRWIKAGMVDCWVFTTNDHSIDQQDIICCTKTMIETTHGRIKHCILGQSAVTTWARQHCWAHSSMMQWASAHCCQHGHRWASWVSAATAIPKIQRQMEHFGSKQIW